MTVIEQSIIQLKDKMKEIKMQTHLSFFKICVGINVDAAASHA